MNIRSINNDVLPGKPNYWVYPFLLLILILLAYSNTFNASWHLDDHTNIVENRNVHAARLSLEDLLKSVRYPFSDQKNGLYRPVAMLTFAMNWYLGGSDVRGYHAVNIGIHCMTAVLLYFTVLILLRAPRLNGRYKGRELFIAFLATALWALHPIQTQAVTYIVQRMASLATFFYLLGIYAYINARSVGEYGKRVLFYGLCFFSFIMAMGTKENAITLPAALLLIELIFYSDFKYLHHTRGRWLTFAVLAGLLTFFIWCLYLWSDDPVTRLLNGYHGRSFSLAERALTQFRILILYLWQIIYPIPQHYSIIHDIELSTSLIKPWSTMASIILIGVLIAIALTVLGKNRLVSFAILFFFLGHSVESTIFPLELIFEHRNYLPTLFLFMPVAVGIVALMKWYRRQNRFIYRLLIVFLPLVLFGIGFSTYVRNMAWANEKTMWRDALEKAPNLARPYQGVALALEREGDLDSALELYEISLGLKDPAPKTSRFIAYSNMGNIYKRKQEYHKAVEYLTKAVNNEAGPYVNRTRYNLVLCLLNSGRDKQALKHLEMLLKRNENASSYLTTKGFILLEQGKVEAALYHLKKALENNPHDVNTLLTFGMALSAKGSFERADRYLQEAGNGASENIVIYFGLLENAVKMEDQTRIDQYLFLIYKLFRIEQIEHFLAQRSGGYQYIAGVLAPVDLRVVLPYLSEYIRRQAEALAGSDEPR